MEIHFSDTGQAESVKRLYQLKLLRHKGFRVYSFIVGSSSVGLGMGCSLWATMVWISSTVPPRPRQLESKQKS